MTRASYFNGPPASEGRQPFVAAKNPVPRHCRLPSSPDVQSAIAAQKAGGFSELSERLL
jgi:hypothetical protein